MSKQPRLHRLGPAHAGEANQRALRCQNSRACMTAVRRAGYLPCHCHCLFERGGRQPQAKQLATRRVLDSLLLRQTKFNIWSRHVLLDFRTRPSLSQFAQFWRSRQKA